MEPTLISISHMLVTNAKLRKIIAMPNYALEDSGLVWAENESSLKTLGLFGSILLLLIEAESKTPLCFLVLKFCLLLI
jgi:hypothetical protein